MEYRDLQTGKDREEFFSRFGVRYTVFAELEYFDIVKWTVVDPMHNLLLGAVILRIKYVAHYFQGSRKHSGFRSGSKKALSVQVQVLSHAS
jgi:hypothetical protein